jgi:RNA polymerase sigma-70 factor (ECF subfamily)
MDETTFAAFHAETYRPLWAYVRQAAGEAALADDVVQEAYLRLLQARTDGLAPPQLRTYLFRIATNLLHDHWRRTRREVSEDHADPDRASPPAADTLDLEAALAQLPPRERAMVWLAHVEGYEHRDIAQLLNVGEKSVRVLLFRARRKLAAALTAKEVER